MLQHRKEGSLVRGQVVHLHGDHLPQVLMLGLSDLIFFFFGRGWDNALSKGDAVHRAHERIALLRFAYF
jgi:hypothetical protein